MHNLYTASNMHYFPYTVPYEEGENFGEFGKRLAIHQIFPHQYL